MNNQTRVAIQTLGCKLNQAESESLVHQLTESGYQVVAPDDGPTDIYILNTCTVTGIADRKCRNLLRRARAANPEALVVAVGCYSKRADGEVGALGPGILAYREDQSSVVDLLERSRPPRTGGVDEHGHAQRMRSFVKIQDGCNSRCAYCIVPVVRGPEKSLGVSVVLAQVHDRLAAGYREVVLTGTNIGSYESDGVRLSRLVQRVLSQTGVTRLRLSSLQPGDVTDELLTTFDDPRLCRHVHMPLQSGSRSVLRLMGRRYTIEEYRQAFAMVVGAVPDVAVTTDMIVGFPGETEDEHRESLALCRELGFAAIHVFPYSLRPGTPAARLEQAASGVKKGRTAEFLSLARECQQRFQGNSLGRILEVLWENRVEETTDTWSGLTGNYIRVRTHCATDISNAVLPTRLVRQVGRQVVGEVTGSPGYAGLAN